MLDPQIIYEDQNALVINKPAGLSVHHDDRGEPIYTLVEWLIEHYPEIREVGEAPLRSSEANFAGQAYRPGLVHRLDKDTSGVMIIAKNQKTFVFLKNQFKNHEVKKVYRAILSGALKMKEGEEKMFDLPIGRSKNDARKRVASAKADGLLREAVTVFRLIANLGNKYAYVEAEPKTGRTHQLRAHFKAYNHPIIGDALYNPNDNGGGAINRQALHAYKLTIKLPYFAKVSQGEPKDEEGLTQTFEVPLPADFVEALEKLRKPC